MFARAAWFLPASLALFAVSAPVSATLTVALDLRELITEADHILVVTAVSEEARLGPLDRIFTDTTLRVEERIHGPQSAREGSLVVLRSLGGVLGGVGLRVEGEPSFALGERALVFGQMRGAELRAIGMSQGVMPMRRLGSGADMILPGGQGLALSQVGSDGRIRSAPGALMAPTGADEFMAQVRELSVEIHGPR